MQQNFQKAPRFNQGTRDQIYQRYIDISISIYLFYISQNPPGTV